MGIEIDKAPCVLSSRFVGRVEFIALKGTVDVSDNAGLRSLEVYIDGKLSMVCRSKTEHGKLLSMLLHLGLGAKKK